MKLFKNGWCSSTYLFIYQLWIVHMSLAKPTNLTTTSLPTVCSNLNQTSIDNNYQIEHKDGTTILSILTIEPIPITFLLSHINGLIDQNVTIGYRILTIEQNRENLQEILLDEVQYLQQCVNNSIGIFVMNDLWTDVEETVEDLEYNIWKLPSKMDILFPRLTHILYEIPWNDNDVKAVAVKATSLDIANKFIDAAKNERMCLRNYPEMNANNISFLIGEEAIIKDDGNNGSGIVFSIPLNGTNFDYMKNLPYGSYVLLESMITMKSTKTDSINIYRLSNILSISSALVSIVKTLTESLSNCSTYQIDDPLFIDDCIIKSTYNWNPTYGTDNILHSFNLDEYTNDFNIDLIQKIQHKTNESTELRQIASLNLISDTITIYHYQDSNSSIVSSGRKLGHHLKCIDASDSSLHWNNISPSINNEMTDKDERIWRIKAEAWVAAGITISVLGILLSLALLIFIVVRIYMEDVLEGNPVSTIMLLISLIIMFGSFVPFGIEYTSDRDVMLGSSSVNSLYGSECLCSIRIFFLTLSYCLVFSLLLCRALMLASIGSEGGFLSHVNGYIQSVICLFSTFVQIGLSTQLLIVMHATNNAISCNRIYFGNWIWSLLAYDGFLLFFLIILSPFIVKSQRNYKEGILITIGSILCLIVWGTWIPLSIFGDKWREITIPLGLQATGWAILSGILIPRSFLVVRGIARSDLAQALPSLASLAFAQNNQYTSEQSIYECVNPAMRQRTIDDMYADRCQSPSEIPTLPLRGASRKHNNPMSYANSDQISLPASPSKATRF